jgi:hypothetical protein
MPMAQFPPEGCHLSLPYALWSRKTTALVLVPGRIRRGNVLSPLQAEKQITSLAPKVKPVDVSIVKVAAVSPGSSEFNWRDYYTRILTALMSDIDEISPGE